VQLAINGRFLSQRTTGVQRMAREFVFTLDALIASGEIGDLDVKLLVQSDADMGDLRLSAIRVEALPGGHGHLWEQFVLPRHAGKGWLLNLGNTAPLVSLWRRGNVAVVIHDISYRIFPSAYRLSYRLVHRFMDWMIMRRAQIIFTVADTEKAMIAHLYPQASGKISVFQNGGWRDDQTARPPMPINDRGYGLYVGSLSRRKNIEAVLEVAIRLARTRGQKFKIVGAASPILSEIRMRIPDEATSLIEFCGQVENAADLRDLYRGAQFLLFPSFYEASALPPIEAMGHGCPVIVSNIPSLRERCGDAAIYANPYDIDGILAAVTSVLDAPLLAQQLIDRGYEMARQRSWHAQALAIINRLRAISAE